MGKRNWTSFLNAERSASGSEDFRRERRPFSVPRSWNSPVVWADTNYEADAAKREVGPQRALLLVRLEVRLWNFQSPMERTSARGRRDSFISVFLTV